MLFCSWSSEFYLLFLSTAQPSKEPRKEPPPLCITASPEGGRLAGILQAARRRRQAAVCGSQHVWPVAAVSRLGEGRGTVGRRASGTRMANCTRWGTEKYEKRGWWHACMHVHACACMCMHACACMCMHVHACMHACMHASCMHACMHAWCCTFPRSLFALLTSNFASGHRTRPQQTMSVALLLFRTRIFGFLCSLLSSLFSPSSVPSSLAAAHFSDRTAHLPLRSVHQATDFAPNWFDPLRLPPWPGGMREAIK